MKISQSVSNTERSVDGKYAKLSIVAGQGSFIFVQTDLLADFKKRQGADGKITIDTSFQYGQKDKTGADRWIVFHDKTKNKPYQVK